MFVWYTVHVANDLTDGTFCATGVTDDIRKTKTTDSRLYKLSLSFS